MKYKTLDQVFFPSKGGAQGNYGKILRVPVDLSGLGVLSINYYDLNQRKMVSEQVDARVFIPEHLDSIVLKDFGKHEDFVMEKAAIINFLSNVQDIYWDSLDASTIFYFDPVRPHMIMISAFEPRTNKEYMIFEKMDGDLEMYAPKTTQDAKDIIANLYTSLYLFRTVCIKCGNFVHRDIKPANVMYRKTNDISRYTVKVGDFSFMESLNATTNTIAGTSEYMLFNRDNMGNYTHQNGVALLKKINDLYAIIKTIAVVVALAHNKDEPRQIKDWFNSLMNYQFKMFEGTLNHTPKTDPQLQKVIREFRDPYFTDGDILFDRTVVYFPDSLERYALNVIDHYLQKYRIPLQNTQLVQIQGLPQQDLNFQLCLKILGKDILISQLVTKFRNHRAKCI